MDQAVAEARASGDPRALARALKGSARIHRDQHELQVALEEYLEAGKLCSHGAAPLDLAHTLRQIGEIHRHEGRFADAEAAYAEALTLGHNHPETSKLELANTFRGIALLKEARGEKSAAREAWQEAMALYEATGIAAGIEEARNRLAELIRQ
jgi:tetratricopeptide (TPR) repeat protein